MSAVDNAWETENPLQYMSPIPRTQTADWVTITVAKTVGTPVTTVDFARTSVPTAPATSDSSTAGNASSSLTPAQIGGILGGTFATVLVLILLFWCVADRRRRYESPSRASRTSSPLFPGVPPFPGAGAPLPSRPPPATSKPTARHPGQRPPIVLERGPARKEQSINVVKILDPESRKKMNLGWSRPTRQGRPPGPMFEFSTTSSSSSSSEAESRY